MAARVLLWVTLVGVTLVSGSPKICELGQRWELGNGQVPMKDALGSVTLVAFLKGTSDRPDIIEGLETLYHQLQDYSDVNVTFLIVNHGDYHYDMESLDSKVSFNTFQDHPNLTIWEKLQVSDLSLLVYKSNGQLTHYLPFTNEEATKDIIKRAKVSIVESDTYFCDPTKTEYSAVFGYNIDSEESLPAINLEIHQKYPSNIELEVTQEPEVITASASVTSNPSSFSFLWNFFSTIFRHSSNTVPALTSTTTPPPVPTIVLSEDTLCTEKLKNGCKKWSTRYLRQARRCCELETTLNCDEFDERKCEKMTPFIKCCLKPITPQIPESM